MKVCSVEGCEGASYSYGWCAKHYSRWRRHGDVHANHQLKRVLGACEVEYCNENAKARGLCVAHYARCRHKGLAFSAEALREYEIGKALDVLERYGMRAEVRTEQR